MQWVQRNIHNFKGDPAQVTIAGESAGAFSVCWHLASPQSQGLFRAAILESSSCDSVQFFREYEKSVSFSQFIATQVKCPLDVVHDPQGLNQLACLRKLPAGKSVSCHSQHVF